MDGIATTHHEPIRSGTVLARSALFCAIVFSIVLSVALLVRSLYGSFAPLHSGLLLLTIVSFVAAADGWRYALRRLGTTLPRRTLWCDALVTVLLVLVTAAVSVPGTNRWALLCIWFILFGHETAIYVAPRIAQLRRVAVGSARALWSRRPRRASPLDMRIGDSDIQASVSQRLLRWIDNDHDVVSAEFHCTFQPQERQQPIHIVFCPPLLHSPTIMTEQLSGPPVTMKTSQCYTFGARLDVRLASASAAATDVFVRVIARSPRQ